MMKKDTTRLVSELAADMVKDILDLVRLQVYAGPSAGIITKKQALASLSTPEQRLAAAQTIPIDDLINQARELEE